MSDWIDWHGGECPVAKGTLVDVKFACGKQSEVPHAADRFIWSGYDGCYRIIAYRLHKLEQPAAPLTEQLRAAIAKRDKQHDKFRKHSDKLSLCEAKVNDLIGELEREIEEATGLPCQIGGLQIKGEVVDAEWPEVPEGVDVDDPKTWRKGDVVVCVESKSTFFTTGKEYCIHIDGASYVKECDDGSQCNSVLSKFRFVRRPS